MRVNLVDHKVTIRFEDGAWRLVDLAPHLDGPIFEPLEEVSHFRRFMVDHDIDTIVWPKGADFSPDVLDEIGKQVSEPALPAHGHTPHR